MRDLSLSVYLLFTHRKPPIAAGGWNLIGARQISLSRRSSADILPDQPPASASQLSILLLNAPPLHTLFLAAYALPACIENCECECESDR
jgi:hypothetical protein